MTDNAIYTWSTTAGNNGAIDSTINAANGQAASTVNDGVRGLLARIAAFVDALGGDTGTMSYGGSSNAYTLTSPSGHALTSYPTGALFLLQASHTNTGAATLAIDGLTAKSILRNNGGALSAGDLVSGGSYLVRYTGAAFHVVSPLAGAPQPLDATLTALAGLTVAADKGIYATGADAFATFDLTGVGRTLIGQATQGDMRTTGLGMSANGSALVSAANYAAMRTALSLVPGTNVQTQSDNLNTFAGIAPSSNAQSLLGAANYAAMRALLDLEAGTDFYSISAADAAISTAISNHVAAGDPHTQYVLSSEIGSVVQGYSGKLAALAASSGVSGTFTVSTSDPSGGADGDVWLKYTA